MLLLQGGRDLRPVTVGPNAHGDVGSSDSWLKGLSQRTPQPRWTATRGLASAPCRRPDTALLLSDELALDAPAPEFFPRTQVFREFGTNWPVAAASGRTNSPIRKTVGRRISQVPFWLPLSLTSTANGRARSQQIGCPRNLCAATTQSKSSY